MADKKHYADHLAEEFSRSKNNTVTQAWIAIGDTPPKSELLNNVTCRVVKKRTPKFVLFNELLQEINLLDYDYIIFTDDDIVVSKGFLDSYIYLQDKLGFSLAQPARSLFSNLSHKITRTQLGLVARETCFVEIGPLFSIHKDIFTNIIPFDESSPMGWGYDYVWPAIMDEKKLKMGIIDMTPVNHSIRPTAMYYSNSLANDQMNNYLSKNKSFSTQDAFTVRKKYRSLHDL